MKEWANCTAGGIVFWQEGTVSAKAPKLGYAYVSKEACEARADGERSWGITSVVRHPF